MGNIGLTVMSMFVFVFICSAAAPNTVQDFIDYEYSEQKTRFENRDWIERFGAGALDQHALINDADRNVVDVLLRRAEALLARIKTLPQAPDLTIEEEQLASFKSEYLPRATSMNDIEEKQFFSRLMSIRRSIALANPLLAGFNDILFTESEICNRRHMCDQYYGHNNMPGGNLFLLKDFRSQNPGLINVLEHSTVQSGRLQGQSLNGGAFISPELSWDGKEVIFAWSPGNCPAGDRKQAFNTENSFHLFKVNLDGSNLVQLTDGPFDDFDPCYLPSGRIAFISTRRGGYGRCHGTWKPTYTLYSMKPDGSDIICLSFHETNEWNPSVNNEGMIVYTRWDYIDRADCIAHHVWLCFPDGRDPRAPHGNYPKPFTTVTGSDFPKGMRSRPNAELHIRAIPGSRKYVATAGPHHDLAYGSLVMIDLAIEDDGAMSQLKRITPEEPFSESENRHRADFHQYGTAWPLNEDFYLANYRFSLVLLDRFGNRDVLYTTRMNDNGITGGGWGFRPMDPIPIAPRKRPPVLPVATHQGERLTNQSPNATIYVSNVYTTDEFGTLPDGVDIKEMRIVQLFPKTTPYGDRPNIAPGTNESLVRMSLGTVPVEADGSVYCLAPVNKEIYFQLLDDQGMAVQSMRSGTYVHPGEQMSCLGCHESKWEAPEITSNPRAIRRPPSPLTPEPGGLEPVNFYRLVKPVFDTRCVDCHRQQGGPDMSYASLADYKWGFPGFASAYLRSLIGGTRSTPGAIGARAAKLYTGGYLEKSHYNVSLTPEEKRRITLWLDLNSNELGAYLQTDKQKKGELIWPLLDVDPDDPQGVETRDVAPAIPAPVQQGNSRHSTS